MDSGKRIYGFWHVARIGHWQPIVADQLAKIAGSGLYEASQAIFVHVLGADGLSDVPDVLNRDKFVATWHPDVSRFEYPTLQILQRRSELQKYTAFSGATNCDVQLLS